MATPANVLTHAKDTLQQAKNFTKSVDHQVGHSYPASQYKVAYNARKTPSTSAPSLSYRAGDTTSEGLRAAQKNVGDYEKVFGPVK